MANCAPSKIFANSPKSTKTNYGLLSTSVKQLSTTVKHKIIDGSPRRDGKPGRSSSYIVKSSNMSANINLDRAHSLKRGSPYKK